MAKVAKKKVQDEPPTQETVEDRPPQPEIEPDAPPIEEESAEEPEQETAASELGPNGLPKRKPGRPRDCDRRLDEPTVLDRIANLESMEGVYIYVYRQRPITNRLLNGNRHVNIRRWDQKFDAHDLMMEAGSGAYLIQCTRLDPVTGKRPMFDSGEVKILNMNYPPRIPPGEWVDRTENSEWQWAKDLIFKQPAPAAAGPDPLVEILREQIKNQNDQMAELRKEMRDTAATANKKDPGEQTIISVLAPFIPVIVQKLTAAPPPPPPDPTRDLLMQYLMKQLDHKNEPATPPPDPMTLLDRQLELQKKIDEAAASRNTGTIRSRKTGTQEMITDIAEAVAPVLQPIVQVIAMGMAQQAQRNAQQQPQVQQQPQQPQTAPPAAELPPAPPPAPVAEQPQPGPQIVQPKVPLMDVIAKEAVNHIEQDKTGEEFGDWYLEQYGEKEFAEAREQGKTRLLADLRAVPATSSFFSMYPKQLEKLVSEFIRWQPAPEDEDDDEDTTPDPVINEIWQNTQQEIGVKP